MTPKIYQEMILISLTLCCTSLVNQREYKYLVVLGGPLWILLPKSYFFSNKYYYTKSTKQCSTWTNNNALKLEAQKIVTFKDHTFPRWMNDTRDVITSLMMFTYLCFELCYFYMYYTTTLSSYYFLTIYPHLLIRF